MSGFAATRATLHALAAGAPLSDALSVGAEAAGFGRHRDALTKARSHVDDPAFRKDTVEQLPFEPPVVSVLLARAPAAAFPKVAALSLEAIRPPADRRRWITGPIGLLPTAIVGGMVATTLNLFFAPVVVQIGFKPQGFVLAGGLALLAGLLGVVAFALRRDRPALWWMLRLATASVEAAVSRQPPPLSLPRILMWLAAGDAAGVVPGAVVGGLLRGRAIGRWRSRLGALEVHLRGSENGRQAAPILLRALRESALGRVAEGILDEPSEEGSARLARLAALESGPAVDPGRIIGFIGIAVAAIAVYLMASEVIQIVAQLGGTV